MESLLAQEKGAGFLEAPALEVAAQQFAADRGQNLIGRRIGSYQILVPRAVLLQGAVHGEVFIRQMGLGHLQPRRTRSPAPFPPRPAPTGTLSGTPLNRRELGWAIETCGGISK